LSSYSATECSVYTILPLDESETTFTKFIKDYSGVFKDEVQEIVKRIRTMARKTGARDQFFRHFEGKPGDGVAAIRYKDYPDEDSDRDPENLRLYCIRYGKDLIILGGGGQKKVNTWQDDFNELGKHVEELINLSELITKRIQEKDLKFINGGMDLYGNLIFKDNDDEQ
jgi:hypothetical protein